jgi:type I restriction enzyme R subunit
VITTLQKFPVIFRLGEEFPDRRYAVIIDEAHSSQGGKAAKELKAVLGGRSEEDLLAEVEAAEAASPADAFDYEDELDRALRGRGRQDNISFFAFTATPKSKTVEMFGHLVGEGDEARRVPFHTYSMRQAIEEGFILDVLKSYTTYQTYWKIEKKILDDPERDPGRTKAAIARFVSLHPHNLAQKAEIIVEHFRASTAPKIGGRAKAMVVTSSRLHAVRYKLAIDRYLAAKQYVDLATLVAFSGKVLDEGENFDESGMNHRPESETAEAFGGRDYQVLIVAEKYQTGFDQPLLHTMYVDKRLHGLAAVQTLSRLNRTIPGEKDDTFVLDFRNTTEEIQRAFEPWYERTVAIPTDPNLIYDLHRELFAHPVIHDDEIDAVVSAILARTDKEAHQRVYAGLGPAESRFRALEEEAQDQFRDLLRRFVNVYGFISQIVSFTSTAMERDYIYARALIPLVSDSGGHSFDIGKEVALSHLRTEQQEAGVVASLTAQDEDAALRTFFGGGAGDDPDDVPLSTIVDALNERFGTNLTDRDQLLLDQFFETWVADPEVVAQARNNSPEGFKLLFDPRFLDTVIRRMDENEAIFKRLIDDREFQGFLKDIYAWRVYQQARAGVGE